jgi:hypothetical protein
LDRRIGADTFENTIATLIDVTSILFAYQIGIARFSVEYGFAYAAFDAFIVVWMRKPIARLARFANPFKAKWTQPVGMGQALVAKPPAEEPLPEGSAA